MEKFTKRELFKYKADALLELPKKGGIKCKHT
jgi:hypothetical protein